MSIVCTTIPPIQLLIGTCVIHLHAREYVVLRASGKIGLPEYAMRRVCVCVFLASGYGWVTVMHEIPISSAQPLTSPPYPRTQ